MEGHNAMYGFSASGPGAYLPDTSTEAGPELVHAAFPDGQSPAEVAEEVIVRAWKGYYVRANGPLLALMCDGCGRGRPVTEVPTGTQLGELVVLALRHERHHHTEETQSDPRD